MQTLTLGQLQLLQFKASSRSLTPKHPSKIAVENMAVGENIMFFKGQDYTHPSTVTSTAYQANKLGKRTYATRTLADNSAIVITRIK